MHFDGNPINYVSFMRNFETCLDATDNSRNLQFLIQHLRVVMSVDGKVSGYQCQSVAFRGPIKDFDYSKCS